MKPEPGDVIFIGTSLCMVYQKTSTELGNIILVDGVDTGRNGYVGGLDGKDLEGSLKNKKVLFNLSKLLKSLKINEY